MVHWIILELVLMLCLLKIPMRPIYWLKLMQWEEITGLTPRREDCLHRATLSGD